MAIPIVGPALKIANRILSGLRWFQTKSTRDRNEKGAVAIDRNEANEKVKDIAEGIRDVGEPGRGRLGKWLRGGR